MAATFPDYARLILDGYGEAPDYGVLRTEMDGGLAKQRPQWSLPIVTRDAQILVMDLADKESFDQWARLDLHGASGWFAFIDPLGRGAKQARIVAGKYKWSSPGTVWIASCQLETIG